MGKNNVGASPGMFPCHNDGGNQEFTLTRESKQFRHSDLCDEFEILISDSRFSRILMHIRT